MKQLLVILKVVVSLGLIVWVVSKADLSAIQTSLAEASLILVLAAAVIHLTSFLLLNLRWWMLLVHLVPSLRLKDTIGPFWLGLFGNNLLPSAMGGDVLRIIQLRSTEVSGRSLLASVLMDRAIGLLGVLLIGLVALLVMTGSVMPAWNKWLIIALLIAIPIGMLVFFSPPFERWLRTLEESLKRHRALVLAINTLQRLQDYRSILPRLFMSLGLTLTLQSLVVICYALLGTALGANVPMGSYFLAIPLLFIAVSLPISVGGLGVREGVFVALMTGLGMAEQDAIGVSVLYLSVILALTLPGGLVLIKRRREAS